MCRSCVRQEKFWGRQKAAAEISRLPYVHATRNVRQSRKVIARLGYMAGDIQIWNPHAKKLGTFHEFHSGNPRRNDVVPREKVEMFQ